MDVALVPPHRFRFEGQIFEEADQYDPRGGASEKFVYRKLRRRFVDDGHTFETIDEMRLEDTDLVLFVDMDFEYLRRLLDLESPPKLAYIMRECGAVDSLNSHSRILPYLSIFDRVFTWNDRLVALDESIVGYNWPQHLHTVDFDGESFEERKLLVNVSGRRYSKHSEELYSAREDVIRYYDEHHPKKFTLHGLYWNEQPSLNDAWYGAFTATDYETYQGEIEDKADAYHRHRFALCFENQTGVDGWITEKIFDCLRSGIVPVYWGAENIQEYVPESAFVDYRNFQTPESLHAYLTSVDEAEFEAYLDAAQTFLETHGDEYSPERYVETIYTTLTNIENPCPKETPSPIRDEVEYRGLAEELIYDDRASTFHYASGLSKILWNRPKTILEHPSLIRRTWERVLP